LIHNKSLKVLLSNAPQPPPASELERLELACFNPVDDGLSIDLELRAYLFDSKDFTHFIIPLIPILSLKIPIVKLKYLFFPPFLIASLGMEKDLMTRNEVMRFLRISKRTLYLMMKARDIPFFKFKRKVLFRKSDLDRWLESKRIK
jgi:excisionase family DNA binding protein